MDKCVLFQPVNNKPASIQEKIIKEIKSAVMQGQLKPGDKLPPERELARMLGVSRSSLREALKQLELLGMVNIKHGQGVFISQNNSEEYLRKLMDYIFIDSQKIVELFQIRKVLETQAVIWACENATDEEIEEILQMLERTKEIMQTKEKDYLHILTKQDNDFHQLVIAAAKNSVLKLMMQTLLDLLEDSRVQAVSIPGRPEKSLEEHLAVAKALRKRDAAAAKNAMLRHLENVERDILNVN